MLSVNVTITDNRKSRFEYHIESKYTAGIELKGTEVKSLRLGQCSLNESYVGEKNNELMLFNAHITEYKYAGGHLQHSPSRPRKLLLHRKEIDKLLGLIAREGYTIIPTKMFFDERGRAKLEIALAKGKKLYDKRETIKKRDWDKQKQRLMKNINRT